MSLKYEISWIMFDGSFDHCGYFDSYEELEQWAAQFPKNDWVWREVDVPESD